ncbi:hypothetical protein P344_05470 [Spiroplasma mirum ATCC 29335]|uniref:Uncharacterized protein n=1 Tax=Spiroplasma mirum ATCC 29335 TaxID=838561 RepID=W0GRP3_9MOLU|nr:MULTISPECIES: SGNH/GDSL hydrolase family protein [Spiroplasma]AHF61309.1 putative arylesterase [Spiroplasma mirum ATCC 29335]AHI58414.1 hypothetical protein P344_05470 [Spiroplasma mirum ATCC 29335]AKM53364.1 hypothetical protein SATRI_v1c09860 [Spiroplasma atrichopogonis]
MTKKITILGDSLTYGYLPMGEGKMADTDNWPIKLADLLAQEYQLVNIEIRTDSQPGRTIVKPLVDFGFPQDNVMDNLRALYAKTSPFDLFIIFLGTNDYFGYDAYAKYNNLSDFNIEEKIVTSLHDIIKGIKNLYVGNYEDPDYKVLIICPPKAITLNDGELLTSLPGAYKNYFSKYNIPVLNLQEFANPGAEDQVKYDGIHYTPAETSAVAQAIFDIITDQDLLRLNK